MKNCTKCKTDKALSEFSKRTASSDGLNSWCKKCKRAGDRSTYNSSPSRKLYITSHRKEHRLVIRQFIYDYLHSHPCVDCGNDNPIVLQFDHRDADLKINNVSHMIDSLLPAVVEEIAKCDVRCANCHAVRTARQFNWYKNLTMPC